MEVGVGCGDLQTVTLRAGGASKCVIYAFGAHVVSFCDSTGTEKIYTSPTAIYTGEKAIRGGIPVCFPQFAKHGELKQHGWARTSVWEVDAKYVGTIPSSARLVLRDTAATRASAWPHSFELGLIVTLATDGNTLKLDLTCLNTQTSPFQFTLALHAYFTCASDSVVLEEYDSLRYLDTTDGGAEKKQIGNITFDKEVDRVYIDTPSTLSIKSSGLKIEKTNMPEAVVWNPYIEKTANLKDMPDQDFTKFICIEPARIMKPAQVQPGEVWTACLTLKSSA